MKRFSDIKPAVKNTRIFDCQQVSITQILNCDVEFHDYSTDVTTRHGDGRYVVKIKHNGSFMKFFTNSRYIKDSLDSIDKSEFPFIGTIKAVKSGENTTYTII